MQELIAPMELSLIALTACSQTGARGGGRRKRKCAREGDERKGRPLTLNAMFSGWEWNERQRREFDEQGIDTGPEDGEAE